MEVLISLHFLAEKSRFDGRYGYVEVLEKSRQVLQSIFKIWMDEYLGSQRYSFRRH